MFKNHTAFILGAGASWHYGYPSGEGLVKKVIEKAIKARDFFHTSLDTFNIHRPDYIRRNAPETLSTEQMRAEWQTALQECQSLIDRLKEVNPLVIDYFLGQNPLLRPIGKLMIAWVVLECEALAAGLGNINRDRHIRSHHNDDWYRFITHKLTTGCLSSASLNQNNVKFITFNYDVSLDHYLHSRLSKIEMFNKKDVDHFLAPDRILHIYGKVRDYPNPEFKPINTEIFTPGAPAIDPNQRNIKAKDIFDAAYQASKLLHMIAPHEKQNNEGVIAAAQTAIQNAACVYILGYGFDENNSKILDLYRSLRLWGGQKGKIVMFTNLNDSNRINKKASKIFFDRPDQLLSGLQAMIGDLTGDFYCEKSTRNVYDAFEQDFDSIEEQLTMATLL